MTATPVADELLPYDALVLALDAYKAAVLEHQAAKVKVCPVNLARASCQESEMRLGIVDVWLRAYLNASVICKS